MLADQPTVIVNQNAADLDRLGDEIAELSAHLDAATARLLALIREFDARGGWRTGFRSCAAWLSWRVGLDLGAARERVRVARALGGLPRLAEALGRGELSYARTRHAVKFRTVCWWPADSERSPSARFGSQMLELGRFLQQRVSVVDWRRDDAFVGDRRKPRPADFVQ